MVKDLATEARRRSAWTDDPFYERVADALGERHDRDPRTEAFISDLCRRVSTMTDDELLSQINAHDPMDAEFARRLGALAADRDALTMAGICEVAARNPNVMEYMQHWEARAESAEAEVARLKAERFTLTPGAALIAEYKARAKAAEAEKRAAYDSGYAAGLEAAAKIVDARKSVLEVGTELSSRIRALKPEGKE